MVVAGELKSLKFVRSVPTFVPVTHAKRKKDLGDAAIQADDAVEGIHRDRFAVVGHNLKRQLRLDGCGHVVAESGRRLLVLSEGHAPVAARRHQEGGTQHDTDERRASQTGPAGSAAHGADAPSVGAFIPGHRPVFDR